jgi:hypothetical protein
MDDANLVSREEERGRVLEMLEQGKISAAEAGELLAALHPDSAAAARPPAAARILARPQGSLSGLPAVAVSLARVLARTIARVSFVVGRVAGTLARLFGRPQTERHPHNR